MGEAKRRLKLLGKNEYFKPKPGRVYHNGQDVFITYLQSGELDWNLTEELRESNSSYYEDAIFTRYIKLDFAADKSSKIGLVKFTAAYSGDGFSIYADFLTDEGECKLPKPIGRRLVDDNFERIKLEVKREVALNIIRYREAHDPTFGILSEGEDY